MQDEQSADANNTRQITVGQVKIQLEWSKHRLILYAPCEEIISTSQKVIAKWIEIKQVKRNLSVFYLTIKKYDDDDDDSSSIKAIF